MPPSLKETTGRGAGVPPASNDVSHLFEAPRRFGETADAKEPLTTTLRADRSWPRQKKRTPHPSGGERENRQPTSQQQRRQGLSRLSIVIPARDEEACIGHTVEHLSAELTAYLIPHEIIVVDDGSRDGTWDVLMKLKGSTPELVALRRSGKHGFGRAVVCGLEAMRGDAAVVMMGDDSDDPRQVVRYWKKLNEG